MVYRRRNLREALQACGIDIDSQGELIRFIEARRRMVYLPSLYAMSMIYENKGFGNKSTDTSSDSYALWALGAAVLMFSLYLVYYRWSQAPPKLVSGEACLVSSFKNEESFSFSFALSIGLTVLERAARLIKSDQLLRLEAERLIVIGDLHTEEQALDVVMSTLTSKELQSGQTKILLIGDLIQAMNKKDYRGFTEEFGKSVYLSYEEYIADSAARGYALLFKVAQLRLKYPHGFYALAGNSELGYVFKKAGEPFRKFLEGKDSTAVNTFIDSLPLFAVLEAGQRKYLVSHGGVALGNENCDDLRNFPRSGVCQGIAKEPDNPASEKRSVDLNRFDALAFEEPALEGVTEAGVNTICGNFEVDGQIFGHLHLFGEKAKRIQAVAHLQKVLGQTVFYAISHKQLHIVNSMALTGFLTYLEVTSTGINVHFVHLQPESLYSVQNDSDRSMSNGRLLEAVFLIVLLGLLIFWLKAQRRVVLKNLDLTKAVACGEGGYGRLFKVPHKKSGINYVVKVYCQSYSSSQENIISLVDYLLKLPRRYKRLVKSGFMPKYYSKGICALEGEKIALAAKKDKSYPCIVMDCISGEELRHLLFEKEIERNRMFLESALAAETAELCLSCTLRIWKERLNLAISAAEAVKAYHREGLLIKELKPEHIIVRPNAAICFIDQDGAVPLGYNWEQNRLGIPDKVRQIHTSCYAESNFPFGSVLDYSLEEAARMLNEQWDIYSFGLVLLQIFDIYNALRIMPKDDLNNFESETPLLPIAYVSETVYRLEQIICSKSDCRGYLFSSEYLLDKVTLQAYKIARGCIIDDRSQRYINMDEVIEALRSCFGFIDQSDEFDQASSSSSQSLGIIIIEFLLWLVFAVKFLSVNSDKLKLAKVIDIYRQKYPIFTNRWVSKTIGLIPIKKQRQKAVNVIKELLPEIALKRKVIRVILAAGKGQRRYPFSIQGPCGVPKPLTLLSENKTLLENAIDKAQVPVGNTGQLPDIYILTTDSVAARRDFQDILSKTALTQYNIIQTPDEFTLVPSLLSALLVFRQRYGEEAIVSVLPSDQDADIQSYKDCFDRAESLAATEPSVVHIGAFMGGSNLIDIRPLYGVEACEFIPGICLNTKRMSQEETVRIFEELLKAPGWYWPVGARIFSIKTLMNLLKRTLPKEFSRINALAVDGNAQDRIEAVSELAGKLEIKSGVSPTLGVFSKLAKNDFMVSAPVAVGLRGWKDYGSILSDSSSSGLLANGNSVSCLKPEKVSFSDSRNCNVILSPDDNRTSITLKGLESVTLAYNRRNNALVVVRKGAFKSFKSMVNALANNHQLRKYIYFDTPDFLLTQRSDCEHQRGKPNVCSYLHEEGDSFIWESDNATTYSNNGLVCLAKISGVHIVKDGSDIRVYGNSYKEEARADIYQKLKGIDIKYQSRGMTKVREQMPVLSDREVRLMVEENYVLKVRGVSTLGGGRGASRPWRVLTNKGTFVFRCSGSDLEKIERLIRISGLAKELPSVLPFAVRKTRSIKDYVVQVEGFYFTLEEYFEGADIDLEDMGDKYFYLLGEAIGRFHESLSTADSSLCAGLPPSSLGPDVRSVTVHRLDFELLKSRLDNQAELSETEKVFYDNYEFLIEQMRILEEERFLNSYLELPRQILHRDLIHPNVVLSEAKDRVIGFIDIETLCLGPRIIEFVNAFLGRGSGKPWVYAGKLSFECLIEGYNSQASKALDSKELALLNLLMRYRFLLVQTTQFLLEPEADFNNVAITMESFKRFVEDFKRDLNSFPDADESNSTLIEFIIFVSLLTLIIFFSRRSQAPPASSSQDQTKASASFEHRIFWRSLDISLILLFLPVLVPLAVSTYLIVFYHIKRLGLQQPVIFKQSRIGYRQKYFTVYKFRTILHLDFKEAFILRRIRFLGLDEIPQGLNILKGQMSIWGPRPMAVSDLNNHPRLKKHYLTWMTFRKPGIVSFFTASRGAGRGIGRRPETWDKLFRLNLYELKNWWFWPAFLVILKNLKMLFIQALKIIINHKKYINYRVIL
ncbi:MAG: sugar transferase, partial [Candidatus Omnitrophica bacterium]|nr:sugar transferase [Candidatus Omnitrophota bacterium]